MSAVRRHRAALVLAAAALTVPALSVPALAPAASATATATVSAAIPAACGMLDVTDEAAVEASASEADDVFVGRVVARRPGATKADPIVHGLVVAETLSGELSPGDPVRVVFSTTEGEPTQLRLNQRYLLFTRGSGSTLQADGCEGYTSARDLDATQIETLREALAPVEETPEAVLSEPDGGSGEPPELGRVVAPGIAISLLGVLGLALISRVGRRRR